MKGCTDNPLRRGAAKLARVSTPPLVPGLGTDPRLGSLLWQMQVVRPEVANLHEPVPVVDGEAPALKGDEVPSPEILERAVDVDQRQPGCLGQVCLRERQRAAPAPRSCLDLTVLGLQLQPSLRLAAHIVAA